MAQFLSFLNIMKKLFFLLMFSVMVCTSRAQSLRYGYFSLDSVFTAMPEYAVAQKNLADLRAKYDEEMKRAEDEFNAKYEELLETQRCSTRHARTLTHPCVRGYSRQCVA